MDMKRSFCENVLGKSIMDMRLSEVATEGRKKLKVKEITWQLSPLKKYKNCLKLFTFRLCSTTSFGRYVKSTPLTRPAGIFGSLRSPRDFGAPSGHYSAFNSIRPSDGDDEGPHFCLPRILFWYQELYVKFQSNQTSFYHPPKMVAHTRKARARVIIN
jgi:hypothetical protein